MSKDCQLARMVPLGAAFQDLHDRLDAEAAGTKFDENKPAVDLLPPDALLAISEVFSYGARKYHRRNWEKGIDLSRLYAAQMRHLLAWQSGEDRDPETGFSHLAHAGCCALMLLSLSMRMPGLDDRKR